MPSNINQRGFGVIEDLLIVVVLVVVGFTGYHIWHSMHTAAKANLSYYDCIDKYNGVPNGSNGVSCIYQDKTYQLPDAYSQSMIRGYQKLPASADAAVTNVAQILYNQVSAPSAAFRGPAEVIVEYVDGTKFIKLNDYAISANPEILYNDSGQWKSVFKGGDHAIACSIIEQYKIPLAVLQSGKGANSILTCLDAKGDTQKASDITN